MLAYTSGELFSIFTMQSFAGLSLFSVLVLMAPLPLNEDSLQEMLKEAGADRTKNVLEKEHFVMVYTSSEEDARELAARLEALESRQKQSIQITADQRAN